jgi:hypothetical protein
LLRSLSVILFTPLCSKERQTSYDTRTLIGADIEELRRLSDCNPISWRNSEVGSTEEFIGLYYKLWDHLRQITGSKHDTGFNVLVDKAAEVNGISKNEARRLKDFGKLGNTIRNHNFYQIAGPTTKALSEFKRLVDNIISPKKLIPKFQAEIKCFSPKDRLRTTLTYMRDKDFSQAVVREKGKLSLLTVEGVAKWLEQQADKDFITVAKVKVGEALACDLPDTFEVMGPEGTISDAQRTFRNSIDKKRPRLFAVIITDNGKRTGKPIGIVTPWDLQPVESAPSKYVFRRDGEIWRIIFEGKSIALRDTKGLQYIALLIYHAREPFHVLDLVMRGDEIAPNRVGRGLRNRKHPWPPRDVDLEKQYRPKPTEVSSSDSQKDADMILDSRALRELKDKLVWLEEELDRAELNKDLDRATRLKEEKEAIVEELNKARGFGGKSREFSDAGEKARKSVQAAISRSLKKIQRENLDLWRYLNSSIKTGYYCVYVPSEDIEWSQK